MQEQINQLIQFQKSFKSNYATQPCLLSEDDWKLRLELSQEELDEYKEACENKDLVEILDSILDRLFLAFGDAVCHGLQDKLIDGFNEVMRSNMSKLDDNGEPLINGVNCELDNSRPFGKILKSKNFFEPNLEQFLK